MDHDLIISSLQEAMDALTQTADTDEIDLALILFKPEKAHPSIGHFLQLLHDQSSLDIFDGKMRVMPGSAVRIDITSLAAWLMRRGQDVGAKQAVIDLQKYLDVSEIPYKQIYALANLNINHKCELGHGISLLPWDDVPDSVHKKTYFKRLLSSMGIMWPNAAVFREITLPKLHASPSDEIQLPPFDFSEILDAILCCGVAGPFAPAILASWLDPPPWVPFSTLEFSFPGRIKRARLGDVWTVEHCQRASDIFNAFCALGDNNKVVLRLAMERLNMAMMRLSEVDSAIDLGIVLEALSLNDQQSDRGELTFRLRIRLSRYLEKEIKKRKKIFDLLGDLYSLRSTAVHTGKVTTPIRGRPATELLEEGYQLAAKTIMLFIKEGLPDWNDVQLS